MAYVSGDDINEPIITSRAVDCHIDRVRVGTMRWLSGIVIALATQRFWCFGCRYWRRVRLQAPVHRFRIDVGTDVEFGPSVYWFLYSSGSWCSSRHGPMNRSTAHASQRCYTLSNDARRWPPNITVVVNGVSSALVLQLPRLMLLVMWLTRCNAAQ